MPVVGQPEDEPNAVVCLWQCPTADAQGIV